MNEKITFDEMKKDIEKCKTILSLEKEIKQKYKRFYGTEDILGTLKICTKYNIAIEDCEKGGFKYNHGFEFNFTNKPYLLNKVTFYKFESDETYLYFGMNGCGRLNFIRDSSNDAYAATNDVWDDFNNTITSYEPLDYDNLNHNYIFSIENGYLLWKDFDRIYKDYLVRFSEALKELKIKKLEEEMKKLKGE